MQHFDERDDDAQTRCAYSNHAAQPEQHTNSYCLTMRTDIAAPNNNTTMTATNTTISAFIAVHLMGRGASRDEMRQQ